jgi:hypothetical protein
MKKMQALEITGTGVALHRGALCRTVLFSSVVMMRYQFINLALSYFQLQKAFKVSWSFVRPMSIR